MSHKHAPIIRRPTIKRRKSEGAPGDDDTTIVQNVLAGIQWSSRQLIMFYVSGIPRTRMEVTEDLCNDVKMRSTDTLADLQLAVDSFKALEQPKTFSRFASDLRFRSR